MSWLRGDEHTNVLPIWTRTYGMSAFKLVTSYELDHLHDLRATRRWFDAREAGWTPAERVRRAAFYACEPWAE